MAIPNETISMQSNAPIQKGSAVRCTDCDVMMEMSVLMSAGGHYIGFECDCGPYSRESGYFPSRDVAQAALDSDDFVRRGL